MTYVSSYSPMNVIPRGGRKCDACLLSSTKSWSRSEAQQGRYAPWVLSLIRGLLRRCSTKRLLLLQQWKWREEWESHKIYILGDIRHIIRISLRICLSKLIIVIGWRRLALKKRHQDQDMRHALRRVWATASTQPRRKGRRGLCQVVSNTAYTA